MTYLGVSGLLVQYQGHVLLTGPFFSNPRLGLVRPKASRLTRRSPPIVSDTAVIEQFLPRAADRASAILVGHGHYDHLLDVPYIATHRATAAVVYGSETVRHMLMGDPELRSHGGRRLVALNVGDAGTVDRAGAWIYTSDSAFRFMPLAGGHAPTIHLFGESYTFASGILTADADSLPRAADDWKLGEPFAFLIDLLEPHSRRTIFRIFYQDAPSPPPLGFPPMMVINERRVDLAVICAATSSNVPQTPDSLLKMLTPVAVLVTHWESFFRSQRLDPEVSRGLHLDAFVQSLQRSLGRDVPWTMPPPHTTLHFRPASGS
ncbi:MAG: MBL fold metallo-hydrolase [Gemmatimonadaceae bacterium]